MTLFVFPPRFRRGKALRVLRLSCQTEPLAGAPPAVAGSGTAENKMTLLEAAMDRGNSGVAFKGTGAMGIWSTSCIRSRSTTEMFSPPELATTIVNGSTRVMDRGRFPTRIGGKNLCSAREYTSIWSSV